MSDDLFKLIFRKQVEEGDPLVMDPNLQQFVDLMDHVKGKWLKKSLEHLQEELDVIYPDLVICYVSTLKSTPGGVMQSFHADFATFNFVRFAGLISFDNSATLATQTSPCNKKTIHLREGRLVSCWVSICKGK